MDATRNNFIATKTSREDRDGNVSYREFVPFAFDLLQKMASFAPQISLLTNDENSFIKTIVSEAAIAGDRARE